MPLISDEVAERFKPIERLPFGEFRRANLPLQLPNALA